MVLLDEFRAAGCKKGKNNHALRSICYFWSPFLMWNLDVV